MRTIQTFHCWGHCVGAIVVLTFLCKDLYISVNLGIIGRFSSCLLPSYVKLLVML